MVGLFPPSGLRPSFPGGAVVKNPTANSKDAKDVGSIPGARRSPGGGNGIPLQCSRLENPVDRGAWRATVHGVTESQTQQHTHNSLLAGVDMINIAFLLLNRPSDI